MIACRKQFTDTLLELAREDKDIVAVTTDARGSVTLGDYADALPELHAQIDALEDLRRDEIVEATEIAIKYRGYIERETLIADRVARLDNVTLRGKFDYSQITQISTEARQKLQAIDPETVGQASRIPGVSPSDINILLVLLGR